MRRNVVFLVCSCSCPSSLTRLHQQQLSASAPCRLLNVAVSTAVCRPCIRQKTTFRSLPHPGSARASETLRRRCDVTPMSGAMRATSDEWKRELDSAKSEFTGRPDRNRQGTFVTGATREDVLSHNRISARPVNLVLPTSSI